MPPLRPRPYERRTLENLLGAQGLSGGTAYDIFSGVQGSALERLARQQAMRMQRLQTRQGLMPQLADFAAQTALGGLPSSVAETAFSGYGGAVQSPLQELIEDLYPAGASVSPYAVAPEGMAGGLTPDEQSAILQTAAKALTEAAQTGTTDFQRVFWGGLARQLTVAGFVGEDFEQAKELLRGVWHRLGGTLGSNPVSPAANPSPAPGPSVYAPASRPNYPSVYAPASRPNYPPAPWG